MRSVEVEIRVDGRQSYACLVQEGNAERVARAMKEACRREIRTLIEKSKQSQAGVVSSRDTSYDNERPSPTFVRMMKENEVQVIDPEDVVG